MQDIFQHLNESQSKAVRKIDGPVLILAGAGSGKTTTIISRLAYLIKEIGIPSSNTLTLTFTNKAAKEMRERAMNAVGSDFHPPLLCTFHKFGLLFLKFNIHLLNRKNNFVIIDTDDKKRILKKINPELTIALVASEISRYKNSLLSPDEVYKQASLFHYQQIAKVYEQYEIYLLENNLVDFDDLISLTYKLLDENTDLREKTSKKYKYIMIDEYQDTNELQLRLIQKLCTSHNNICVVGDDDQSIYGWRGANVRNIVEFDKDFKKTEVFKLEENYRSFSQILKVANALIEHNRSRIGKKLISTRGNGEDVVVYSSHDENEEAKKIADQINKLMNSGEKAKDIAILYRVNALSRSIEDGLNRAGVSYKLVGGLRFYDRAEIKDIISYIRLITNFNDDFSFKRIVNKPRRGLGKVTIDKIELSAFEKNISIYEYVKTTSEVELQKLIKNKNTKTLKTFINDIEEVSQKIKDTTYDFIELLEEYFDIKSICKGLADENERIQNMEEFFGLFRDYVAKFPDASLDTFLNDIILQNDQDQTEEDGIYMMSIHASKGLEFKHVFIIGLEEGFLPLVGDGNDLEEERRLGYVGFTRAKDTLNISYVASRYYKGRRSDVQKSRFLQESGLCEGSLKIEKSPFYKKGDLVRHKIFEVGRVLEVGKSGREYKLNINFSGIHRSILASFVEKL